MLFYESASCLHGRRKVLKGKYYASIFAHYQPVDTVMWHWKNEVRVLTSWTSALACSIFFIFLRLVWDICSG